MYASKVIKCRKLIGLLDRTEQIFDQDNYELEGDEGLFEGKLAYPEIPAQIPGVDLEGKQTIPVLEVMDEITSDEESVSAYAAANANTKRNNLKPANITGVDKQDQEPIKIPPITSNSGVPLLPISDKYTNSDDVDKVIHPVPSHPYDSYLDSDSNDE